MKNIELKICESFGSFGASGDIAIRYLEETVIPLNNENQDAVFIFDFQNVRRMNSSFANALIGIFYASFGKEKIRIKNLDDSLKIIILAALEYGETLRQQENENAQPPNVSYLQRIKRYISLHIQGKKNS